MVPAAPTAHPWDASTKYTSSRLLAVFDVWAAQSRPPFVVVRMTPPSPTAHPCVELTMATPRMFVPPKVRVGTQLLPLVNVEVPGAARAVRLAAARAVAAPGLGS